MSFYSAPGFTSKKWQPYTAGYEQNRAVVEAKLKRAKDNNDCWRLATERVNFQNPRGSICGLWRDDAYGRLRYIVYSYGEHFPLYVWDDETKLWFKNTENFTNTTNNHMRKASPCYGLPKHPLTGSDIDMLARYGLIDLIGSKVNLYANAPKGADPVKWRPVAARPFLHDPELPAMLRPPGLPHELDVGLGREKQRQAELACEALNSLGWHPRTLGGWEWSDTLHRSERKILILTTPTNAHREILYGKNIKPVVGARQGKPVVKFYHPINKWNGKPAYYPVWIEFQTKAEAREACKAIDTMRRIHLFGADAMLEDA